MIVLLVTVPMTLHYLGPERFGLWMVLSSLAALVVSADFGIGNGVLNLVARASGNDDDAAIRTVGSSALVILTAIGGAFAVASVVLFYLLDWAAVFHLTSDLARAEAAPAVLMFGLSLAVGVPLNLGNKVQVGLQQGYAANLWVALGGFFSLVAVVAAIQLGAGTPVLVLALFGSQQLAMLLNYIIFFYVQRPELAPRLSLAKWDQMPVLFGLGSSFFVLQIVAVITYRFDAVIIARMFGSVVAGNYAVYERIFSLVTILVSLVLMPLWPAYGEAVQRGDHGWIRATFRRSLFFALGATLLVTLPLALFYGPIVHLWIGRDLPIPMMVIVGLTTWKFLEAFGATSAMLLNALNYLRPQIVIAICMGTAGLVLKLTLAPYFGIQAIVWSTILSYGVCAVIPLIFILRRVLRNLAPSPTAG